MNYLIKLKIIALVVFSFSVIITFGQDNKALDSLILKKGSKVSFFLNENEFQSDQFLLASDTNLFRRETMIHLDLHISYGSYHINDSILNLTCLENCFDYHSVPAITSRYNESNERNQCFIKKLGKIEDSLSCFIVEDHNKKELIIVDNKDTIVHYVNSSLN